MSNGITLPYSGQLDTDGNAFEVRVTSGGAALAGYSFGVDSDGHGGNGVFAETDVGSAVFAVTRAGGVAVDAQAEGRGIGVSGSSGSGRGVQGESDGDADGVYGRSAGGAGMFGEGPRCGVQGKSGEGPGVFGESTGAGDGVTGRSVSGSGVAGISADGFGVYGRGGRGAGQFDGNVHVRGTLTCDVDVVLSNGRDCAEEFELADGCVGEAGSVMVLDEQALIRVSSEAYDRRVVGVVSGAGGLHPALLLGGRESARQAPIAIFGRVACKCDAQYGSIGVGDLLTSSPTPAHAMRASDSGRGFGAVIGKALGSLQSGTGLIPILVCLQ